MNQIMRIYQKCEKIPFGDRLFSKMLCFKAPYFASISPLFRELKPGFCEIHLKKRRSVTNHLNSVHAIAMCNVSELAAGSVLEASIPEHMRWIPKQMTVSYLKLAKTDVKAVCETNVDDLETPGEYPVFVDVYDKQDVKVFQAVITMYLSARKEKPQ